MATNFCPRLFALVCTSSMTVEYSSTNYSAVQSIYKGLPEGLRGCFEVVRYDPNPNWTNERKPENGTQG